MVFEKKQKDKEPEPTSSSWVSLLTMEYYQTFFDVSTKQVQYIVSAV